MRNSTVALIAGAVLFSFAFWTLLHDPDSTVRSAADEYFAQGKKVMDDYTLAVQTRMELALNQLFQELDINQDGIIQRSEFKGAVVGMMAALRAVDNQRPVLPKLEIPSVAGVFYWIKTIFTLQVMFMVALFMCEHLRALLFGDSTSLNLTVDYVNAKPRQVPKSEALSYTTPMRTMSMYEKCKMVFFIGSGIAFVRLFFCILFFMASVICISMSVHGGRTRIRNPFWFRFWMTGVTVCGTIMMLSLGFSRIVSHGQLASSKDRKILVGNHVCVIEVIYLFMHGDMPSFVSRIENLSIPMFRAIVKACDAILVNRDAAASRIKTLETIKERVHNADSLPVMIFPEGTCNGQNGLFQYRRGAFEPGEPVQMVCFKFPYKHFNPTWNGRPVDGNDLIDLVFRIVSQFVNRMEVAYLPVYQPTPEEKADPSLYANRVQGMMAAVLDTTVTDATYADYVEKAKEAESVKRAKRETSLKRD